MAGFFQGTDPDIDAGSAQQSAQLAQEWATKLDGPVQDSSYSAHYHAQAAATSATSARNSSLDAANSAQDAADAVANIGALTLGDLANVSVPEPNDGDVLVWVAANSQWEAAAPVIAVNQSVQDLWARIAQLETKLKQLGLLP